MFMALSVMASVFFVGGNLPAHATVTVTNGSVIDTGPYQTGAGICLCFDGQYVDDWYSNLAPLLQEYNATATFFLSGFPSYTSQEYQELSTMQAEGDEMASNTVNHTDILTDLENETMAQYIATEITPAINAMDAQGMNPTDFAYPYSDYNSTTNAALLNYFDHLQIISPYDPNQSWVDPTFQMAYYNFTGQRVLGAIEIDNIKGITLNEIYGLMDSVKANNSVIIFSGMDTIESNASDYITPPSLITEILQYATENHLKFYTMNQLETPNPAPIPTSTTISLGENWSLVSMPVLNTTLMASELGGLGVRRVASYDQASNSFVTDDVGYSASDMQILPDVAYFVDSAEPTSFLLYGTIEGPHSVTLSPGWNMVGWRNLSSVSASDLGSRLPDIQRICTYDQTTGGYDTYFVGYSSAAQDFSIQPGQGYFIYLNSSASEQLEIGGP
jgi:peptidoglycan-N-acetylglucosamine deacetylase